jgi:hypothetical protein
MSVIGRKLKKTKNNKPKNPIKPKKTHRAGFKKKTEFLPTLN